MHQTKQGLWTKIWNPFWALPAAITTVAILLGLSLPELDFLFELNNLYVLKTGPEGARNLCATTAGAMISITGLVFSITIVVLQLASSQFTPRVLGTFLKSRIVQLTLGTFVGTFIYALTVLRSIRGGADGQEELVPQFSVSVCFVLVLACIAAFFSFIEFVVRSIQVSQTLSKIGSSTYELVKCSYDKEKRTETERSEKPSFYPETIELVNDNGHGILESVDYKALLDVAQKYDFIIEISVKQGDFLHERSLLAKIHVRNKLSESATNETFRCFDITSQRSLYQDISFGIRQIVDIATRALSPGINDPSTASLALNELHRILLVVASAKPRSTQHFDKDGNLRIVHQHDELKEYLLLAFEEIAYYGKDSIQIPRRIEAILNDLKKHAVDSNVQIVESVIDQLVTKPSI